MRSGTSLQAANWLRIGGWAGRSRFPASGAQTRVTTIWLYPLARDWRAQQGVAQPDLLQVLGRGKGLVVET